MVKMKATKGKLLSTPTDLELAVAALVFFIIGSVSLFMLMVADHICLFGIILMLGCLSLFGGLVISPIALIYMIVTLIRKRAQVTVGKVIARFILAVILISASYFFLFAQGTLRIESLTMRTRVALTGGIDQLQDWAVEILEKPFEEVVTDPNGIFPWLKKELYSKQLKDINPVLVLVISKPEKKYVIIRLMGGGFIESDSGVIVASPSAKVETDRARLIKWRDGVYAYFGKDPW